MRSRKSNFRSVRKAFTLIELLLVMVIIAILAGIVIPKYVNRIEGAKINAAKGDLSNIKQALDLFAIDCERYPTTEEGLNALVTDPGNLPGWQQCLPKLPMDPWGDAYVYRSPGTGTNKDYDLFSCGADKQEGTADDVTLDK
jgi:general secretion pathway protein G